MNRENRRFFFIVCLVTVIGAIVWSAVSLLQEPRPLFIAFLAINVASLAVNTVCFAIDIKNTNTTKN